MAGSTVLLTGIQTVMKMKHFVFVNAVFFLGFASDHIFIVANIPKVRALFSHIPVSSMRNAFPRFPTSCLLSQLDLHSTAPCSQHAKPSELLRAHSSLMG